MRHHHASAWQSEDDIVRESVVADMPGLLRPIIDNVTRGSFVPESAVHADPEELARAICAAVGRPVTRIVLVSHAASAADEAWMRRETYSETLKEALEHRLGFGLSMKLGGQRWKRLREECGYEVPVRLADFLAGESIRIPKENLRASVFVVTGFVLAQDVEMAARLRPLLRLMPRAIPLGELKGETGAWLVLVP